MSGLSELLTDIAAEAKTYGGTEKAVRSLRRHRRLRRLAPLALAVVVLAGVAAVYVQVKPATPPVAAPDTTPHGSVPWLPTEVTVPTTPPPVLPTDHGVDAGSLIYQPATLTPTVSPAPASAATPTYLLTSTGTQYRLPDSPLHDAVPASLSPDGTRLLYVQSGHLTLRDLTGTATFDLGALPGTDYSFGAFWSGDSSRLAVRTGSGIDVVTVNNGRQAVLPALANRNTKLCGVRASGDVLVCSQDRVPFQAGVFVLDGRTGAVKTQRVVDVMAELTAAERQGDQINTSVYSSVFPLADGDAFLLRLNPYDAVNHVTNPGDLLLVDMATGNTRRLRLPEEKIGDTRPQSGGIAFGATDGRYVLAALPDGVYLAHVGPLGPTGTAQYQYAVHSIERVDPATGSRLVVATLVGGFGKVALRGTPMRA